MKAKLLSVLGMSCLALLLMGCGGYGGCGGCGSSCTMCRDYDHDSVCGEASCTSNAELWDDSDPCPGPYQCNIDP